LKHLVEKLGKLRLGLVNVKGGHDFSLVHFWDQRQGGNTR
jgi:hypothetical protein